MAHRSALYKLILFLSGTVLSGALLSQPSFAQQGPSQLNISGGLFNSAGQPITSSNVRFKIDIYDKNATCLMYTEQHTGVDLSGSRGAFSLIIGAGTSAVNNLESTTAFDSKIFENPGAVAPFTGCGSGLTLSPGDTRLIRVSYDIGGGLVAMTPDIPITSSAYAMVAETLQGKAASDFIMTNVNTSLSQTNVDYIFSNTNYPNLKALVDGTSTQYIVSNPSAAVGFNGQRLINVGTPTSGTDATNKTYVDSNLGGKTVDVTGVGPGIGGGRTLVWDQTQNKWVTSATGAVGLVAAGAGLNGGNITASGTLSVDVGTTANKILQLDASARIPAVDASLLTNVNAMFLQGRSISIAAPAAQQVLGWNGATSQWEPETPSGGTVTGLTGDVTGTGSGVISTTIQPNAVTSAKINNTGVAVNRLLITDATTGATVGYASCAIGEVMQWTATGWACKSVALMLGTSGVTAGTYGNSTQVSQISVDAQGRVVTLTNVNIAYPVTSVAGRTGAVTLTASDVSGLGTAATQNVGTGVNNVLQFTTAGQLPALDGSLLTNLPSSSQWTTAGSDIYRASGNVGIGTTSPNNPLDVNVGANAGVVSMFANTGTSPFIKMNNTNSGAQQGSGIKFQKNGVDKFGFGIDYAGDGGQNWWVYDYVAAQPRLLVDASGNVGIGTISPNYKLDVAGTVNASALMINGVAVGTSSSPWQMNGANTFYNLGNVGIGTSSPTVALDVAGIIRGNNGSQDVVIEDGAGNTAFRGVHTGAYSDGLSSEWFQVGNSGDSVVFASKSGATMSRFGVNSSATMFSAGSAFWGAPAPVPAGIFSVFNSTNANVLTIQNSGNVGIGTMSPVGILDVEGGTAAAGVAGQDINIVAQSGGTGVTTGGNVNIYAGGGSAPGMINLWAGSQVIRGTVDNYSPTSNTQPVPASMFALGNGWSSDGNNAIIAFNTHNTATNAQNAYFGITSTAGTVAPAFVWGQGTPTGYSERMRMDPSGNVGIGTTSPSYKLDVAGTVNASALLINGVAVGTSSSPWQINGSDTYYTAGNVGIGTSTPQGILDVRGGTASSGNGAPIIIQAQSASGARGGDVELIPGSSSNNGWVLVGPGQDGQVINVGNNSAAYVSSTGNRALFGQNLVLEQYNHIREMVAGGAGTVGHAGMEANAGTINFYTSNAATGSYNVISDGPRVTIDPSGNMGIGTTSPSAMLEVNGQARIDSTLYLGNAIYQTIANTAAYAPSSSSASAPGNGGGPLVALQNSYNLDSSAAYYTMNVSNSAGTYQYAYLGTVANTGAGNYAPSIVLGTQTGATAYSERMRIDQNGNVGIGTTTPGYKLDVAGTVNASALTINGVAVGTSSSPWQTSGSNTYYNLGNVGIGTSSPGATLDVSGTTNIGSGNTNYVYIRGNNTANAPVIAALGSDTDIGLVLSPKGAGTVSTQGSSIQSSGNYVLATSVAQLSPLNPNTGTSTTFLGDFHYNGYIPGGAVSPAATGAGLTGNVIAINGTLGNGVGVLGTVGNNVFHEATITNAYAGKFYVSNNSGLGTNVNGYGVYIDTIQATNKWSLYVNDATAPSYFAGNVGIGTATPAYKLDVAGTVNASALTINGVAVGTSSSPWQTSGANTYYNLGNVGIGTTNPNYPLQVEMDSATSSPDVLAVYNDQASNNMGESILFAARTPSGTANVPQARIKATWDAGNDYGDLVFQTATSGSLNDAMFITFGGQVGFGTPMNNNTAIDVSSSAKAYMNNMAVGLTVRPTITAVNTGDALNGIYINPNYNDNGQTGVTHNGMIVATGNVGIGTTSPAAGGSSTIAGRTYLTVEGSTNAGVVQLTTAAADADGADLGNIEWVDSQSTASDHRLGYLNILKQGSTAGNRGSYMAFATRADNGTSAAERMRIDNSGNLYIGSIGGSARLDAKGATSDNTTAAFNTRNSTGTSLFMVLDDGTVGIGTTTPGYKLDVAGAINATSLLVNGVAVGTSSSPWQVNGTSAYYNGGNVGIGTSSPAAALQVGTRSPSIGTYNSTILAAGGANSGGVVYAGTLANTASPAVNNETALTFAVANYLPTVEISAKLTNTTTNTADLLFYTFNGVTTAEAMRVTGPGNVGIGTATPNYKLDVAGSINASSLLINGVAVGTSSSPWQLNGSNTYYSLGNVGIGTATPTVALDVAGSAALRSTSPTLALQDTDNFIATVGFMSAISGKDSANANAWIVGDTDGTQQIFSLYGGTGYPVAISSNGTERMRISTSGNVGIGTTTPGALLDVEGGTAGAGVNGTDITLHAQNGGSGSTSGGSINLTPGTPGGNTLPGAVRLNGVTFVSPSSWSGPAPMTYGAGLTVGGFQLTDTSTAASGTQSRTSFAYFESPTLNAANTSVTTTDAANIWVNGPVRANTNETITDSSSIYVASGLGAAAGVAKNGYGIYVNAPVAANNNYAATFMGGNVGIGTVTPAYTLDVNGTINASSLKVNGVAVGTSSSPWQANGADTYYNLGNVGIGTMTPGTPLQVYKKQNGTSALQVYNDSSGTSADAELQARSDQGIIALGMNSSGQLTDGVAGAGYIMNYANTGIFFAPGLGQVVGVGLNGAQANPAQVFVQDYKNAGTGRPQYLGNWQASSYWGIGPATGIADNTVRLGVVSNWNADWAATQNINFVVGGSIGIGTTTPKAALDVSGTGTLLSAMIVPRDTTANRPSAAVNGMIRYNTSTAAFEGFSNGTWGSLGGSGGSVTYPLTASPHGSPAAPAYSFLGNVNAGMYSPNSGDLAFATGGNEVFRIDQYGESYLTPPTGFNPIHIIYNSDVSSGADHGIYVENDQSAAYGANITFDHNRGGGSLLANDNVGSIEFQGSDSTTGNEQMGQIRVDLINATHSTVRSRMIFSTINGTASSTDRMAIDYTGSVGIGTNTPLALLDLYTTASGQSAIIVPRDTTANRPPTGVNGMIRYATDTNKFEVFQNGGWTNMISSSVGLPDFTDNLNTAGPNSITPAAQLLATNAATDVDVALTPKGNGSILAQVPDGTIAGGNKRSQNAVDLQMSRGSATAVASGTQSVIVGGYNNTASGASTFIGGGNSNTASTTYASVVGGNANTASGFYAAVGGGQSNNATGLLSTVPGGKAATASGNYSMATNSNTTADSFAQTTLGQYNLPTGTETANSWVTSDPLFVVGNGTSSASKSNALVVLKNGNVGIGTTSPASTLDVNGHIGDSATGTPTLSSCGTSPTIFGNDTRGTLTVGATGTTCVLTFATAYTAAPYCVITPVGNSGAGSWFISAVSTTQLSLGGLYAGQSYTYICLQ